MLKNLIKYIIFTIYISVLTFILIDNILIVEFLTNGIAENNL